MNRILHLRYDSEQLVEVEGYMFLIDVVYNTKGKPKLRVERND